MDNEFRNITIDKIIDPENPMRTDMDRDNIFDLSESIKREGLINPITVRPVGDKFEVVAGHRRFVASKIAGLSEIPCVIRELSDQSTFEIMAHENLHREDVDPVDEALFIGKVIGDDESKIPDVAKSLNRSIQWIEDRLDILTYPDYMLPPLKAGILKLGVAKFLAQILDDTYRKIYVEQAINQGMGVRQAEYLAQQYKMGVLIPLDQVPDNEELGVRKDPPAARATCARCGKVAIHPNLQNVFIHVECPSDDTQA